MSRSPMVFVNYTESAKENDPMWFFVMANGQCLASDGIQTVSKFMCLGHLISEYGIDLGDYEAMDSGGILPPI